MAEHHAVQAPVPRVLPPCGLISERVSCLTAAAATQVPQTGWRGHEATSFRRVGRWPNISDLIWQCCHFAEMAVLALSAVVLVPSSFCILPEVSQLVLRHRWTEPVHLVAEGERVLREVASTLVAEARGPCLGQ